MMLSSSTEEQLENERKKRRMGERRRVVGKEEEEEVELDVSGALRERHRSSLGVGTAVGREANLSTKDNLDNTTQETRQPQKLGTLFPYLSGRNALPQRVSRYFSREP
jgi:hypothetical protein